MKTPLADPLGGVCAVAGSSGLVGSLLERCYFVDGLVHFLLGPDDTDKLLHGVLEVILDLVGAFCGPLGFLPFDGRKSPFDRVGNR